MDILEIEKAKSHIIVEIIQYIPNVQFKMISTIIKSGYED